MLPVGALLLKIVTASEDDPALAGVRIVDAYFYRSPGAMEDELNLKLNGSIADIGQAEILRKACNEKWLPDIMRDVKESSIRVDTDPPPSAADSDMGLMVRPSSTAAASVCFTTGMEAFMREDYEKSLKYLTYATQDDPKRTEIKYWRVAALIALGENERAEQIVKKMTPANRARPPYYSSRVLSSLEPLNGPKRTVIRQQLDLMVRQAVCCQ